LKKNSKNINYDVLARFIACSHYLMLKNNNITQGGVE